MDHASLLIRPNRPGMVWPWSACSRSLVLLLGVVLVSAAENSHNLPDGLYTRITTERGVVVCEIFFEKAPLTERATWA